MASVFLFLCQRCTHGLERGVEHDGGSEAMDEVLFGEPDRTFGSAGRMAWSDFCGCQGGVYKDGADLSKIQCNYAESDNERITKWYMHIETGNACSYYT